MFHCFRAAMNHRSALPRLPLLLHKLSSSRLNHRSNHTGSHVACLYMVARSHWSPARLGPGGIHFRCRFVGALSFGRVAKCLPWSHACTARVCMVWPSLLAAASAWWIISKSTRETVLQALVWSGWLAGSKFFWLISNKEPFVLGNLLHMFSQILDMLQLCYYLVIVLCLEHIISEGILEDLNCFLWVEISK